NADLADASLDARLTLSGPIMSEGSSSIRPEILVTLKGPYAAPKRTIDVSTLSGWLMLRSVERQAKQIDVMEAQRREVERRDAEARAVTSTIPAALPAPPAITEEAPAPPAAASPRVVRPHAPTRAPAP